MARSNLLDLLPDFSEHRPTQPPQVPPGFEPLVHAALSKEEFSALDMPVGFTGISPESEPEIEVDPFADLAGDETGDFGALDDLSPLADPDLPGLDADLPGLSMDIDTEAAAPDLLPEALPELDLELPAMNAKEDVGLAAAETLPGHDALEAAHREEIERLQEAHREALDSLLNEAIPNAKREIADAIAEDLAPLLTGRIRASMVESTLQALTRKITEVMDDASAITFDLRGPEYLISAFQDAWSGDAAQIRPIPDDGVDLVARIDRTVIATRLSEFDRLIGEAST